MSHQHPVGHTVEPRIVGEAGSEVLALELQIGCRPGPGNDDHRGDVAQLTADRFVENGVVLRLPPGPILVLAEDDGIVRLVGAGDVDGVDGVVVDEVGADVDSSVDDAQVAGIDEGGQRLLEDRPQVLVDRVHLEEHDRVLGDELVQGIHRRNRGDVAGAEDHHHRPVPGCPRLVGGGHVLPQVVGIDPGLHPHVRPDAREQQAVPAIGGEHPGGGDPVGTHLHLAGDLHLAGLLE